MTTLPFIVELKRLLPESDWPWLVAGLHQDTLVWSELRGELGSRVLEKLQSQSSAYLPAVISLIALGHPDPMEIMQHISSKPGTELYHLLNKDASSDRGNSPLGEAGVKALEVLELWGVASSWEGLEQKLGSMTPTTAACLFGLLRDPVELLYSLLATGHAALAAHALLSNPAPHSSQAEILAKLLEKSSPIDSLPLLRILFVQRPVLAVGMAQKILKSSWWEQSKGHKISSPHITILNEEYDHIMTYLFRAEIYRLAAQPKQAIPILSETIRLSRHLQAEIAAQLAQAAAEDDDWQNALSAWEQASHLNPDSLDHLSGFLMALIDDNQSNKAEAQIREHPFAIEYLDGQPLSLLISRAELALQNNQKGKAQACAIEALNSIHTAGSNPPALDIDPRLPVTLARLLLDADMPQQAVQAAQSALQLKSDNVEACNLLADSLIAAGQLGEAIEFAHLAVSLAPDRMDLRSSLVDMLEAAQDWQSAFQERSVLIDRTANPSPNDLYMLADSALHAGLSDHAIQVCEQMLTTNAQDGAALAIYAQALAQQGHVPDALEILGQATQDIPSHPSPWLALAQIQRNSGDKSSSLETLRAASQATQDEPQVLLDLGEAYLDENLPTQALVPLRQAFQLMQSDNLNQTEKHILSLVGLRLGQTLFQLGHTEDAHQALEAGYHAAPYNTDNAYFYARALLALDQPQPALPPLQTVIRSLPDEPQPYMDYARCVLRMDGEVQDETYQSALHYLGMAEELAPGLPEIRALSAEIMAASGDLIPAISAYRKALDTPLAQDPAWQIRLWLGLGKVALDLGQFETAIAALQEASLAGPENPDVQRFLCEAYDAAGLVENAFEAAQSTRDLASGDIDALIWFAQKIHDLQSRPGVYLPNAREEAVQALEQATRQATHQASLLARLGGIQLRLGETEAAHNTFRRLIGEGDEEIPGFPLDASPADLHCAALGLIEIGDASAAVVCLERALQQNIEDSSGADHHRQPKTPQRIQLLTDLATALKLAGQPMACLRTLEQAIHLDGSKVDLYVMKADLLTNLDDPDTTDDFIIGDRFEMALDALETALEIDPTNASLHIQSSLVLRKMGEISKALNHAEQAIQLSLQLSGEEKQANIHFTSSLLAADLAHALLQYDRASEILANCTDETDTGELVHQIEFHCLRAELFLEESEYEQATVEIARAIELDPDDPSLLALQARLSLGKSTVSADGYTSPISSSAVRIFNLAMENYTKTYLTMGGEITASSFRSVVVSDLAARRRLANAAQELRHWEPALDFARQNATASPDEPDSHLQLARLLVMRAEYQRNCQALDVITHAPGDKALSEDAFGEFQFAIQIAEDLVLQWLDRVQEEKSGSPSSTMSSDPQRRLKQWQTRGKAIFYPSMQSAEELATLPSNPENVVAQIACLYATGDLTSAGKVASQYAQNPSVLCQLAIALSDSKPRQALVAAQGALEALFSPEVPSNNGTSASRPDLPQDHLLTNIDIPMVFTLLGRLIHQQNEPTEDQSTALHAIQKALILWADEPRWHTLAAEIVLDYPESEDPDAVERAIFHLEQAIQLDPDHARSYQMLGRLYETKGMHSMAIELLNKAAELAPREADIWLLLAQVHRAAGNMDEAVLCAEKAANLAPKQTKPLIMLAEMELKENHPEAAKTRAQNALEIEPDNPEALVLTARALKALEQPAEAIALLEKALPIVAEPIPLHLEHIQLIHQAMGLKTALDAAKELSNRYPENSRVLSLLAETLEEDGQIQAAVQTAQRALRCKNCLDTLNKEELAYLHYNLGRLLSQTGQLDQSIHQLVEAIEKHPSYVEPYLELGHVHQQRRQHAQALQAFHQAIDAAPTDSRPYYHAGLALKESKDYLEAEKMLRKASELAPEDLSIHRLLGAVVALNLVHNRRQPSAAM